MTTIDTTYAAQSTAIYIAHGAPATYDAAGFAAMTWNQVGRVTNFSGFDQQAEIITSQYLEDNFETKRKGIIKFGASTIEVDVKDGDSGQTMARSALTDKSLYGLKIAFPNGRIQYLQVLITQYTEKAMQPNGMVSASIGVQPSIINTGAGGVNMIEVPAT